MPARLRWHLAGVTVLLLAAALASVGVAQYLILRGYLLERSAQAVSEQTLISIKLSNGNYDNLTSVPGSPTAIYDARGHLLAPPNPLPPYAAWKLGVQVPPWADPGAEAVRALLAAPATGSPWPPYRVLSTPRGDLLVTAAALPDGRALVVESSLADVNGLLTADIGSFAAVAGVALLATAALAVWLTARALAPLERVAGVARAVSEGAYDRRTNLRGAGEVARVGAAFDEMVDRLQAQIRLERDSEARMRRFLADASHELRTPVTGILGHLEVLRRGARADLEESLAAMHVAAERMARLVGDLLTLTRFEQAEARLRAEPLDADVLVREAVRAARSSTGEHLVVLDPAPDGLAVVGDRDATERILVNLLDNAAKYSPAGTRISLSARPSTAGQVELLVSDHGPGVVPEERERIFERLYRGDRSRAATANHGAGLGLAICRALARGQGGDVTVHDTPGGGATFVVTLPGAVSL